MRFVMIRLPERSNTLLFEMSMQLLFHVITGQLQLMREIRKGGK